MAKYILPVDTPRYGFKHKQRSTVWPFGHPGVDLLPTIPRDRQDVRGAADGICTGAVGGLCQGFDWRDDNGYFHRYCHLDVYVQPLQKFKQGEVVAQMAPKGLLVPPGTTHLHWVSAADKRFTKQVDPLSLIGVDPSLAAANIPELFKEIWRKPGAPGEIAVFEIERKNGVYKDYYALRNTMTYWFQQVYPDGVHLSPKGDAKWQRKKEKVLKP